MATSDVPGKVAANRDKLAGGCWAEHQDGSFIYVTAVDEADNVIFNLYDFTDPKAPATWTKSLPRKEFETQFTYDPKGKRKPRANIRWTWHDKSPMPWDRLLKMLESPKLPTAAESLSVAKVMAEEIDAKLGDIITADQLRREQGLEELPASRQAKSLGQRIKNAIAALKD